jgi:hypothetical protein
MKKDFAHLELGCDVQNISGYYTPLEEHILLFEGKEVFYTLGHACVQSSCCGMRDWHYLQVAGFLLKKHAKRGGEQNLPISEMESIEDPETRRRITAILNEKHPGTDIDWI